MSYMKDVIAKLSEPLTIDDIEWRLQSINNGGYGTILGYKDARVDMRKLDEATGGMWQRSHQIIDGNLYCKIEIWDEDTKQWVGKTDVGTESMAEATKGQASDSFKRAGFNFGIGRDLYDLPLISVKLIEGTEFRKDNGRMKQSYGLKLKEWTWGAKYDGNKVVSLAAKDHNGKLRFNWSLEKGVIKNSI